jgi:hypothetical protein
VIESGGWSRRKKLKGTGAPAPSSAETRSRLLPPRILRVGITGARELDVSELPRLRAQVKEVLTLIKQEATRVFVTAEAQSTYAAGASQLHLLSPLAEGADRLVAELALDAGFQLSCPLPFTQVEYEKDFAKEEGVEAFRSLLARAESRILELDGGRTDTARAYEAVGRLIVRNCDLLIGIWDGGPGHGRGGTAEIIRYAANFGPPVYWIHATDPAAQPAWVDGMQDLRERSAAPAAQEKLSRYLSQLLLPPGSTVHRPHSALQRLGQAIGRRHASPLDAWWNQQQLPQRTIWRAYAWFIKQIGGAPSAGAQPRPPSDAPARYWYDRYEPADNLAGGYAARYRSAWFYGFILGAIALWLAAGALVVPAELVPLKSALTGLELGALGLIALLVILDSLLSWHARSIEYRLLAELCRSQQALASLAWSMPGARVQSMVGGITRASRRLGASAEATEQSAWVAWLFAAWQRAAPLPFGRLDQSRLTSAREAALTDLIEDQLRYHRDRARQCGRASAWLVSLGEIVFFVVIGIVVAKLVVGSMGLVPHDVIVGLGLIVAILFALSAAFVGIRAYAELELLTEQSDRMAQELEEAKESISGLRLDRATASQDLGVAVLNVAMLMLQDLEGWAHLFRVKAVEAG